MKKKRKNANPPIPRTCLTCEKTFYIPPSDLKYGRGKFCSCKCYTKTGESNPKWRGGKIIVGGYIYIHKPNHPYATKSGYVCEHKLVVEKRLGRILDIDEVVHHLNGTKNDNKSENLIVVTPTEHTHIHKDGVKQSPKHIQKRFANRKKADMSRFERNDRGQFIGTV